MHLLLRFAPPNLRKWKDGRTCREERNSESVRRAHTGVIRDECLKLTNTVVTRVQGIVYCADIETLTLTHYSPTVPAYLSRAPSAVPAPGLFP
ncbi:hypothetical protein MRX96_014233 [Rhipicephalus microplus]